MKLITPEILAAEYWKQIKKEKRRSQRKQVIFDELILKENPSPEDINRYMGHGATCTICSNCEAGNQPVILVYIHDVYNEDNDETEEYETCLCRKCLLKALTLFPDKDTE